MKGRAGVKRRFSSLELGRWTDRLFAPDPGLQRLRNASRLTLVVAAAALISYPIVASGSPIAPLFGGIVGLLAVLVVSDDGLKDRKVTTLLLFVPATLSVMLGALLAFVAWLEALAVLAIIFFALYLRRFGPRYVAVGMMALMPLFIYTFMPVGVDQLPWILISVAVGILCAYLFRFLLMPDRPRSVLRRSMAAFDIQLGLTLDAVTETVEDRRSDEDRRKRLRREAERLNECTTTAEGHLSAEDADVSREHSDRMRLYLFDAEMSANTLLEVAWHYATSEYDFPPKVRDSLLRALRELRAALPETDGSAGPEEVQRALEDLEGSRNQVASGVWSFQARRAEAAIRQLSEGAVEEPDPGFTELEEEPEDKEEKQEEVRDPRRGGLIGKLRPTTTQGIQAALASGLALLAGLALSPSRPYWVVIMAFVVFMGSGTVGDTLSRAFQRMAGTLLGAVFGFLLAAVVSGNLYLEAPVIVACVFLAFYLLPVSQTIMMFWITVMLAVAFEVIGQLGTGILALRVFDTLLGSVIGLAVSALVLPTRTSDKIRECTADFLDALKDYVCARVDNLAGGKPSQNPVEEAREVANKLREITQNAATARKQATVFGRSRADLDRRTTALMALSYYARHLAGPVNRSQHLEDQSRQSELLREAGGRIAANLDSLREAVADGKQPEIQDIQDLMEQLESDLDEQALLGTGEAAADASGARPTPTVSPVPERSGPANALHYLRRINHTLEELSTMPDIRGRKQEPDAQPKT